MIWGIVKAALGFVAPLRGIVKDLTDARVQLANAKNEGDRIQAQARVDTLELRMRLQAEESKVSKLNIYIRSAIGAAVAVLLWKLLVFDKALGQWTAGSTDPLGGDIWGVVTTVIQFYFITEAVAIGGSAVRSIWGRK